MMEGKGKLLLSSRFQDFLSGRVVGVGQVTCLHVWLWLLYVLRFIGVTRVTQIIVCVCVFCLDVDIATFIVIWFKIAGKTAIFCAMVTLTFCPSYSNFWSRKWLVSKALCPIYSWDSRFYTMPIRKFFQFLHRSTGPLHLWCAMFYP